MLISLELALGVLHHDHAHLVGNRFTLVDAIFHCFEQARPYGNAQRIVAFLDVQFANDVQEQRIGFVFDIVHANQQGIKLLRCLLAVAEVDHCFA